MYEEAEKVQSEAVRVRALERKSKWVGRLRQIETVQASAVTKARYVGLTRDTQIEK